MKRDRLVVVFILLAASVLLLSGCGQLTIGGVPENVVNGGGEDFLRLSAPVVKAYSYPGTVYATFTSVSSACDYEIQVDAEGVVSYADSWSNLKGGSCPWIYCYGNTIMIDYLLLGLTDSQKITFRSAALSASDPGKRMAFINSAYGTDSARLIIPPYGTHALELSAYENGYDNLENSEFDVLTTDDITVIKENNTVFFNFPGKQYLNYQVYLAKDYEQTHVLGSVCTAKLMPSVNNGNIGSSLYVSEAGTYNLVIKVTSAADEASYPADLVVGKQVTYEALVPGSSIAEGTGVEAAYVEAGISGNVARLSWIPAIFEDEPAPVSFYRIYRRAADENELVEVTADIKTCEKSSTSDTNVFEIYYLEDIIPDVSKKYLYTIVLTDNGRYASSAAYAVLLPKPQAHAEKPQIESIVINGKGLKDGLVNDIAWFVTLNDKYQSFKAYLIAEAENYGIKPLFDDFDLTKPVPDECIQQDDDVSFVVYTEDINPGKAWLMVVVSEEGKLDDYVISEMQVISQVPEPVIHDSEYGKASASLSVRKYDDTITNANDFQLIPRIKDDILITFTDYLDSEIDDIGKCSYTLYQAEGSYIKSSYDGNEIYYMKSGKWTEIADFRMELDTVDKQCERYYRYVGITKLTDVEDGCYLYKVVKTDENGRFVTSNTEYVTVDEKGGSSLGDYISGSLSVSVFKDSTYESEVSDEELSHLEKQCNRITLTVISDALEPVFGTGLLEGEITGHKNDISEMNKNVTYIVFRSEYIDSIQSSVFTKIGEMKMADFVNDVYSPKKLDDDGVTVIDGELVDIPISVSYIFDDIGLPTGRTYEYKVVAHKEGFDDYVF